MKKPMPKKEAEFDNEYVKDICEFIYIDSYNAQENPKPLEEGQARKRGEMFEKIVRHTLRFFNQQNAE